MADLSLKSEKKKKRKLTIPEENQRPSKTRSSCLSENEPTEIELDQKLEERNPWRNLKLILSIQNKDIDLQKKVELVFTCVNLRVKGGSTDADEDCETVKTSRLIVFLSDWIQSLLISTEKKIEVNGDRSQSESGLMEACLDFRCWVIFKFCLEESLKWHVSLSFSRNLLRAISCIARNALSLLNEKSLYSEESFFVGERFELYNIFLDCVSLVFSLPSGLLNENLDLWVSTIDPVLQLVLKTYAQNLDGCNVGAFVLRFSCLVLEQFSRFLKVHPTRKNGFRDFVDKLLEPLLHLLGGLHLHVDDSNRGPMRTLLKSVEEVLSNGLFHPTHINGFLGLRSVEKYLASHDGKVRDTKTVVKSYHRHLFDKLESFMAAKKVSVLNGIGQLFHLLVDRVKRQKGASVLSEGTKTIWKIGASSQLEKHLSVHMSRDSFSNSTAVLEQSDSSSNLNSETRKSLFEFFVQIMEPLLYEMNGCGQAELVEQSVLLDVHCTLKSVNNLLASFMLEKVYLRTEDISEGACLNFLKKVHDAIMSLASNLPLESIPDVANGMQKEMFTNLAKELLVAVGYLLDIEYEVFGNDFVSLWLIMLSYLGIGLSFSDAPDQHALTTQTLDIGCQLINLYSELRQVDNIIFALCKAARLLMSFDGDDEVGHTRFLSINSLPCEAYARSVGVLLCSQEFRLSFQNAIRSIPEGQASGCIRQLTADILESMKWMKGSCSVTDEKEISKLKLRYQGILGFDLQVEILGRYLSEMYALVLDSLIVTVGNSNVLGLSIKDLMTIVCPCISSLVQLQPDSVNEFLFYVTGKTFENGVAGNKTGLLKYGLSTRWVFVFFFRLYLSCRSLYRQVISLMPPNTSKKMSAAMGDSFSAYSGKDWMEKIDWTSEGYFSWIVQSSISLVDVIKFVSDIYLKGNVADCCILIFVLHAMALQRLVDLNKQIKSLEYLLEKKENADQINDDAELSQNHKQCKKWRKRISVLNREAAGLADFMMGYVSQVITEQLVIPSTDDAFCEGECVQELHGSEAWTLGICAIDEKSFPAAMWWIISQNIGIWCTHAASKKLKIFLSILICTALPCIARNFFSVQKHIREAVCLKKVTVHQISSELFSDSFLYEHKFVRRHLASRFCLILEKSALSLFKDFVIMDVDFSSSPDWTKVLSDLENSLVVVSGNEPVTSDSFLVAKSFHSLDKLPTTICKEQKAFQFSCMKVTVFQSLLNLLCWMPKGYLNLRSFSLYATYILNLERIVVGSLLQCRGALFSHGHYELFKLFVSCRRTLKNIIMASCEEKTECSQSSLISMLSEGSHFVLWLFKSVFLVAGLQEAFSDGCFQEIRDMIVSLMDHTSYIFLTLSKYHFNLAIHSFIFSEKPRKEQPSFDVASEHDNLKESGPCSDFSEVETLKSMFLVLESLEEEAQILLVSLKDTVRDRKLEVHDEVVNFNKLSLVVSCFSGILWGLVSLVNQIDAESSDKVKLLKSKCEPISKLNLSINIFSDFICSFLHILVVEDDESPGSSCDAENFQNLDYCSDPMVSGKFSLESSIAKTESSCNKQHELLGAARTCPASFDIDDDSKMAGVGNNLLELEDVNSPTSFMAVGDLIELQCLKRHFLQGLLKGTHPEAANLLRQLLVAAAAILRLNLQISSTSFSSSLMPTSVEISKFLLSHLANMVEVPQPFTFVWLDGVLRYLEELGRQFPLSNPTLTRNVYAELIELHLRAIGRCISLQGKKATLASHERESSIKILDSSVHLSEASLSHGPHCLDEFKSRLRMSFKELIKKPSDLHLLSAVQAIERALVGVHEGCTMMYEINTGSGDGGKVSSIVAAGIDCLDLVLEYVSGRKRLNVVKRHIQNIIAALVNIIVHLQSPLIFYEKRISYEREDGPDPGSVILMCIEVLTRVSGKHALFQMDSWHVAQSIRIPTALFQNIRQLRTSEPSVPSNSATFSDNQNSDTVDRQFSINLFASSCRLLYTILKHHKSECEQCIALLEESVCILLHCLEMVDTDLVTRKGYFSWEVQEGVKCACFLRRIYEEVRQQKDVFGHHSFKFLSNYIWIYSGYGPLKTGIKREIDEALKPGVYALIDACSANDLQYLHTAFGEGPCRNTLASLQYDYKLNFRYEGKV